MEHAVLDKASIREAERLNDQDIARARAVYYDTLAHYVQDRGQVVIDKMPLNITKVPLIHRVFPNALYFGLSPSDGQCPKLLDAEFCTERGHGEYVATAPHCGIL